jgi:hypothetical protein
MNLDLSLDDFDVAPMIDVLRRLAIRDNLWVPSGRPKGSVLIRQGHPSTSLFILQKGLVKLAYETAGGDEWIKSFIADTGMFAATDPGSAQAPSRFRAECLEACAIAQLPLAWVGVQLAGEPRLLAAYAGFSAWVRRRKEAREEALRQRRGALSDVPRHHARARSPAAPGRHRAVHAHHARRPQPHQAPHRRRRHRRGGTVAADAVRRVALADGPAAPSAEHPVLVADR